MKTHNCGQILNSANIHSNDVKDRSFVDIAKNQHKVLGLITFFTHIYLFALINKDMIIYNNRRTKIFLVF